MANRLPGPLSASTLYGRRSRSTGGLSKQLLTSRDWSNRIARSGLSRGFRRTLPYLLVLSQKMLLGNLRSNSVFCRILILELTSRSAGLRLRPGKPSGLDNLDQIPGNQQLMPEIYLLWISIFVTLSSLVFKMMRSRAHRPI